MWARFLANEVLYSGHLQSAGAASVVAVAAVLFGHPVTPDLLLVPYLVFQAIYYNDRYHDIDRDAATNPVRTVHLRFYQKAIPVLIVIFLVAGAAIGLMFGSLSSVAFIAVVAIFGLLYPKIFKAVTKRLPLFKNFYVAAVFAVLVFFPAIYYGEQLPRRAPAITLFSIVLAESLIMQFLLDVKDDLSDRAGHLRTLPAILGRQLTLYVVAGTSLLVLVAGALATQVVSLQHAFLALIVGSFLFNVVVLREMAQHRRHAAVIAAAKYLLWPLFLLLA